VVSGLLHFDELLICVAVCGLWSGGPDQLRRAHEVELLSGNLKNKVGLKKYCKLSQNKPVRLPNQLPSQVLFNFAQYSYHVT
jgi:hypothetical protein